MRDASRTPITCSGKAHAFCSAPVRRRPSLNSCKSKCAVRGVPQPALLVFPNAIVKRSRGHLLTLALGPLESLNPAQSEI